MKNRVFILLVIPLLLFSCSREDVGIRRSGPQNREQLISDAQELFLQCLSPVTKGSEDDECFTFKPGVADVDWDSSEYYERRSVDIEGVESCYGATFGYRAIFPDSTVVNCDKEVLLVKNQITGDEALFLKYYIPYPGCGTECEWSSVLSNDGDAGDYTGVILYTTLEGYPVRFDRYMGGEYTLGIFLPYLDTEEKCAAGYEALVEMLGGVTLQRVVDCQTKGGDYSQSVNEVKVNDPLQESICIAEHGLSELEQQSLLWDAWVYWAWMNRPLNPIGTVPGEGLGGSAPSTQDDDKDKDKEDDEDEDTLDDAQKRITKSIVDTLGIYGLLDMLAMNIDSLFAIAADNQMVAYALRNTKNLERIEIVFPKTKDETTVTHRDSNVYSRFRDGQTGEIVDSIFRYSKAYITVPYDLITAYGCKYKIGEELFHIAQLYDPDTKNLGEGDLEIEAKIFDCLLWRDLGSNGKYYPFFSGPVSDAVEAFLSLYDNPCQKNFDTVVYYLSELGYTFSANSFTMMDNFDTLFKHIKRVYNNNKFLE